VRVCPGDAVEVRQGEGDGVGAVVVTAGEGSVVDEGVGSEGLGYLVEVLGAAGVVDVDVQVVGGELADDDLTALAVVPLSAHEVQHLLVRVGGVAAVSDAIVEVEAHNTARVPVGGEGGEAGVVGAVVPVGGASAEGEAFEDYCAVGGQQPWDGGACPTRPSRRVWCGWKGGPAPRGPACRGLCADLYGEPEASLEFRYLRFLGSIRFRSDLK
jgi:hypothetical protein